MKQKKVGIEKAYLGSSGAFSSQFFLPLIEEQALREYFHKSVNEGYLVKYVAPTIAMEHNARGYVLVLYTDFGAFVEGSYAKFGDPGSYADIGSWMTRTAGYVRGSVCGVPDLTNVRYDVVYLSNVDMANESSFCRYVASGLPKVVREGDLPRGSGLLFKVPYIMFSVAFGWYDDINVGTPITENMLFDRCRQYVLEGFYKSKQKAEVNEKFKSAISRSAGMWPEAQGLWTRFVDNVGVYLPNYMDVDLNLTEDLGQEYVGCNMSRVPSTEGENFVFGMKYLMDLMSLLIGSGSNASVGGRSGVPYHYDYGTGNTGTMTVGGQSGAPVGAIPAMIRPFIEGGKMSLDYALNSMRVVMPRVRAFGRQFSPDSEGKLHDIPSWEDAWTRCEYLWGKGEDVSAGILTGKLFSVGFKRVVLIPKSEWDAFVDRLKPTIYSQAAGGGGIADFPY